MKLDFIELGKLTVSKANMRYARKAPDISDILPSVRARGVLVPILVRPCPSPEPGNTDTTGTFESVAGRRRFHAAQTVAAEDADGSSDGARLPCAILEAGDDAAAIEASLIENIARLDPDEVTQWETFVRLVKQGRSADDIAATFGLPERTVRRVLALGNLLPRIRNLYRAEEIDAATVRHLTMATSSQQRAWLALYDDANAYVPTGHQLKAWLFGGAAIPVKVALFDLDAFPGAIVGNLFEDERFFADPDQFWAAQNEAIEARRAAYLDAGWTDVIIVPPAERFSNWEYERTPKRKGGRVYIDVSPRGEVSFHEGYLTRKEAKRREAGESDSGDIKPARPEVTSTMRTYLDLHRHAAVRAAMTGFPLVALRLMVAHAICGSSLWTVRIEPQTSRNDAVSESVETSPAEAAFDERLRAILDILGLSDDEPTVVGRYHDDRQLVTIFGRLLDLPDAVVMEIIAVVMGETLASGSEAVDALGFHLGVDMTHWWRADDAFFDLIRDRQVLTRIVADIAGETTAEANAKEKTKTLKALVRDRLDGTNGRAQCDPWVPRWMTFPATAYTDRGGTGQVSPSKTPPDIDPAEGNSDEGNIPLAA